MSGRFTDVWSWDPGKRHLYFYTLPHPYSLVLLPTCATFFPTLILEGTEIISSSSFRIQEAKPCLGLRFCFLKDHQISLFCLRGKSGASFLPVSWSLTYVVWWGRSLEQSISHLLSGSLGYILRSFAAVTALPFLFVPESSSWSWPRISIDPAAWNPVDCQQDVIFPRMCYSTGARCSVFVTELAPR